MLRYTTALIDNHMAEFIGLAGKMTTAELP
ncbi:Uncharacterised protein [Yersinia intermedia]|uniref:Uncharacterized protein n=1 Tax=Yersinia intermedia TaxID=631 RepID=A0A0H5LSL6_YERIN|nr:Uncharacterised protein [Yersinia intermedia]